jgi:hypothetical protein
MSFWPQTQAARSLRRSEGALARGLLHIASLGVIPGTYVWTWGSLPDQSFTLQIGAVPGPIAGAGLPGLIFAGGGLLAWWRTKRKPQAVA